MSKWRRPAQSVVEFALIAPLLILMLLGAIDLGRAFGAYVAITNASREGARVGSGHLRTGAGALNPNITNRTILEATSAAPELTGLTVVVACAPSGSSSFTESYCLSADIQSGHQVRVTVRGNFQLLTLYLFGVESIPLSHSTTMAIINLTTFLFGGPA